MKRKELIETILEAIETKAEYFGVRVETKGMPRYDIVINKYENLDYKIEYYINNYNEDLELKTCPDIKITRAGYADELGDMEYELGVEEIII